MHMTTRAGFDALRANSVRGYAMLGCSPHKTNAVKTGPGLAEAAHGIHRVPQTHSFIPAIKRVNSCSAVHVRAAEIEQLAR